MEQNFKLENVMMCDGCGRLFVTSKYQRENAMINHKIYCRVCEKLDEVKESGHLNFSNGRE